MRTFKENLLINLKKFRFIKITVFKIKQLAFYFHNRKLYDLEFDGSMKIIGNSIK